MARGSIRYQVRTILWRELDKIGNSKRDARKISENKGLNGHKVAEDVFSVKYKGDVLGRAQQLLKYTKKMYGNKDIQSISNEMIHSFIIDRIEDGVTRDTLSTYLSQLEKIRVGLEKIPKSRDEHHNLFSRDGIKKARKEINLNSKRTKHLNRAYLKPDGIINEMRGMANLAAKLQFNWGLRSSESTQMTSVVMKKDYIIDIYGKGGFLRSIDLSTDKKLYNQINSHIKKNGSFSISYQSYRKEFMRAVAIKGEVWSGTHGARYTFSQRKFEEFLKTMSYKSALTKISHLLGHKRWEISKIYLSGE